MRESEISVQDKVADYYEYTRYNNIYSRKYQFWWTDKMLSLIKSKNLKGKILDNGCGIGIHLVHYLNKSEEIIGLDISQKMCERASNRLPKVVLGDSQALPFEDNYFDVIFARSLLHHLPNPEIGVSEMKRVLKNNGEAVFSDTNNSLLSCIPRIVAKKGKHFSKKHKNFKRNEMINVIEKYLKIEKIIFFGYLTYPLFGFPDLFDFTKYIPMKNIISPFLVNFDEVISKLPIINTQSWGIIIKASKGSRNNKQKRVKSI